MARFLSSSLGQWDLAFHFLAAARLENRMKKVES
jgi:hypothetical protein